MQCPEQHDWRVDEGAVSSTAQTHRAVLLAALGEPSVSRWSLGFGLGVRVGWAEGAGRGTR
jgi:hypothetical protein